VGISSVMALIVGVFEAAGTNARQLFIEVMFGASTSFDLAAGRPLFSAMLLPPGRRSLDLRSSRRAADQQSASRI
jgi:hypothetical protein